MNSKNFDTFIYAEPFVLSGVPIFMKPQNAISLHVIFNIHDKIRKSHGKTLSLILIGAFDRLTKKLVRDDVLKILYCNYGHVIYGWNWFYETKLIEKLIEKIKHNKTSQETSLQYLFKSLICIDDIVDEIIYPNNHNAIFHMIVNTVIPNFSYMNIAITKEDYVRNTRKLVYIKHQGDKRTSGVALCPKCKTDIHGKWYIDRCFSCGQKLKWKRG